MLKKKQLYQQFKRDIQLQHWLPGQILTQQQLAQHYAVSRIVVRDVQQHLLSEGWLCQHGKAGMQVPRLSAEEAEELCILRLQLEPLALRLAAPNLNFTRLGQAEDILTRLASDSNLAAYQHGELNWQFHRTLYQPCNKPHLLKLLDQLHQQVSRYLGYQEHTLNYQHTSATEHHALLAMLREQQTDNACNLLTQHIQSASLLLVRHLKNIKAP